jgi:hypothetical protein
MYVQGRNKELSIAEKEFQNRQQCLQRIQNRRRSHRHIFQKEFFQHGISTRKYVVRKLPQKYSKPTGNPAKTGETPRAGYLHGSQSVTLFEFPRNSSKLTENGTGDLIPFRLEKSFHPRKRYFLY